MDGKLREPLRFFFAVKRKPKKIATHGYYKLYLDLEENTLPSDIDRRWIAKEWGKYLKDQKKSPYTVLRLNERLYYNILKIRKPKVIRGFSKAYWMMR